MVARFELPGNLGHVVGGSSWLSCGDGLRCCRWRQLPWAVLAATGEIERWTTPPIMHFVLPRGWAGARGREVCARSR